jgi:putative ABC transport system permease protein
MRIAFVELWRRPGRFVTATAILTLIAILLMFLGSLLDGLISASTGAIRAQDAAVIVYSADARASFARSRIDSDLRRSIDGVDGITDTGGIGLVQLGARLEGRDSTDLVGIALFGVEIPPRGVENLPAPGGVIADEVLEASGVEIGTRLLLGPARSEVTVVGFTSDTGFSGQAGVWADPTTWRAVVEANRPDARVAQDVFQALVVQTDLDATTLAARIDAATGGATESLSIDDAVRAIPGVEEQQGTFAQIIAVTILIATVVIALFFALLTVERTSLYGVLKALGARSRTLFLGVIAQAVVVTVIAAAIGAAAVIALDLAIPPGSIPVTVSAGRLLTSAALLLGAAIAGCAFSLRRILRIDPASAIGTTS